MNDLLEADGHQSFIESEEWIAAEARQLFRARQAGDARAVKETLTHFENFLTWVLACHLRDQDPVWDIEERWIDDLGRPVVEYPAPGLLLMRGRAAWVVGQEHYYYDPVEFELELCPQTGAFRTYVFRFGDHCPLSEKVCDREIAFPPIGGWAFEVRRQRV